MSMTSLVPYFYQLHPWERFYTGVVHVADKGWTKKEAIRSVVVPVQLKGHINQIF